MVFLQPNFEHVAYKNGNGTVLTTAIGMLICGYIIAFSTNIFFCIRAKPGEIIGFFARNFKWHIYLLVYSLVGLGPTVLAFFLPDMDLLYHSLSNGFFGILSVAIEGGKMEYNIIGDFFGYDITLKDWRDEVKAEWGSMSKMNDAFNAALTYICCASCITMIFFYLFDLLFLATGSLFDDGPTRLIFINYVRPLIIFMQAKAVWSVFGKALKNMCCTFV